jgi:copper(I)-binding protein
VFTVGLILSGLAAAEQASEVVSIDVPYARETTAEQPISAVYMRISNAGDADHALVGASSPVAKAVELHRSMEDQGMSRMRHLESLTLKSGSTTMLQPGGLHLMLIGLAAQLKVGDAIEIELRFDDGTRKSITAPVQAIGMMGGDMPQGKHHEMH